MAEIRGLLQRRPGAIFWLVAAYFILAVILRLVRPDVLQPDEAEQAFQSQFLLLGYGRQPPFYNWLQHGVVELFGLSVAALSILKNTLLFLTFLFYGMAARLVLKDGRLMAIAVAGLLTLPPISIMAQRDLTHAIAALFAVSVFLYGFLLTLKRPSLGSYVLMGVAVGIGFLSKYNFVIVPLAAVLAMLPDARWRERLLDWRTLVAIGIAAAICMPHLLWALDNLEDATEGTVKAMRDGSSNDLTADAMRGLGSLTGSALVGIAAPLAFFGIAFHRNVRTVWRASSRETRLIGRMIIICLVIVALIALVMGATDIRQKWLSPFLIMLPLYLSLKLDAAAVDISQGLRRFLPPVATLAIGFLTYLTLASIVGPLFGYESRKSLPYGRFVAEIIPPHGERPRIILAQGQAVAGNMRLHLPEAVAAIPDFPEKPVPSPATGTALVVWLVAESGSETVPEMLAALAGVYGIDAATLQPKIVTIAHGHTPGGPATAFGYAFANLSPPASR